MQTLPRQVRASILAGFSMLAFASPALAANFCVSTAAELTQALLDARHNGQDDTIQLVQGTYVGHFLHIADLEALSIEGGYLPGCGSRVADPANTVLDGAGSGRTLFFFSNNPVTFSVDSVTVQNGRTPAGDPSGAGLKFAAGNVTPGGTVSVSHCVLQNNAATQDGGGMFVVMANVLTVTNSTFQGNTAGFGGGAYMTDNAAITLTGNVFANNSVSFTGGLGDGAGFYADMTFPNRFGSGSSTLTATGNAFDSNHASISGGAFFVCGVANAGAVSCSAVTGWTSSVVVNGNTITSNTAQTGAGGDMVNGNSFSLDANTWTGNSATNAGGALAMAEVDNVTVTNGLMYGNTGSSFGGAVMSLEVDTFTLTNNTVSANSSGSGGGIWVQLHDDSDALQLYNNLIYANSAGNATDLFVDNNGNGSGGFSPVTLEFNDFDASSSGFQITQPGFVVPASNLNNVDPAFANPGAGDYHLTPGSPVRDAGDNAAPSLPDHDHDFLARIVGGTVDLGAFELQSADLSIANSDGQTSVLPGALVTYTIVVANAGPSPVSAATVTDAPPGALSGVSWTCAATGGSSCSPSGSGAIDQTVSLAVGGSVTYSLTGALSASATGTLVNTANVSAPANIPDPNPANNSATDTDTVVPLADLSITNSDGQLAATPGSVVSYSIVASNSGPSGAPASTVTDLFPASLTGVTWTCAAAGGASCGGGNGSGDINRSVDLPVGGTTTFTASGTINAGATGTLVNTASVAPAGGVVDPDGGNDSATDVDNLTLSGLSELVHGSVNVLSLASAGPGTPADLFWLRQQPRSSYEVVVDGVTGDIAAPAGTGPSLQRLAADAATVLQSSVAAGAGSSRSLRFENAASSAQQDEFLRVESAGCTSSCGPEDEYRIRAWDTTYAAARFNNSATQVTVLVLENATSATVSGHVWLRGASGALLASQPFTLLHNAILALNTSTLAPGASGSLTISNDAPYGALSGKVVAVEPATGFTFDTPLVPRER